MQPNREAIQAAVRARYARAALSADGLFSYPTGREGAAALGYDPRALEALPPEILTSFCGVGNPFLPGEIRPGESVCDVGCGAGFDLLVAGRMAGERGRACGWS